MTQHHRIRRARRAQIIDAAVAGFVSGLVRAIVSAVLQHLVADA
jgi:hypothetical protein